MAGPTIDHMISMIVFLGAILLFIGLFNQTIQTGILYQRHRQLATKCSDLLDNILLNPGYPLDWGKSTCTPASFGLQDPEFTQYKLSPYSLMRLQSSLGDPVNYTKTGLTYSNVTMGFGSFLLVPFTEAVNYSLASRLLGTNNTVGFQLSVMPVMTVSIAEEAAGEPLTVRVQVSGIGFPLPGANLSYCFLRVVEQGTGKYPHYSSTSGSALTDATGSALLAFEDVVASDSYALIVYARLGGLVGIGYHSRVTSEKRYVIPFIDSFADRRVLLAHSYDVHHEGPPESAVFFNATFVLLTEEFVLREMPIDNSTGKVGKVNYGEGQPYRNVTIPTFNPGILVITYETNNEYGVVMMPWGIGSMAFPVVFGDDPHGREWVATDLRQVVVNGVTYQATLAIWSLEGYGVTG